MRGKRIPDFNLGYPVRITPARAGKTLDSRRKFFNVEDHPRACGENNLPRLKYTELTGSPPRVRGKQFRLTLLLLTIRITPARAGKTIVIWGAVMIVWDHPRACGENQSFLSFCDYLKGSPPRVRGKLLARLSGIRLVRITPARAGKTNAALRRAFFA